MIWDKNRRGSGQRAVGGIVFTKAFENDSRYLANDLNYLGYSMKLDEFIKTDIDQMLAAKESQSEETCQMSVS